DFAAEGTGGIPEEDFFGALVQYPGASGRVWDPSPVLTAIKETKAVAIVAADLLALTMLASPGTLGADVTIGTSQRFGIPLGFGGPHAGTSPSARDWRDSCRGAWWASRRTPTASPPTACPCRPVNSTSAARGPPAPSPPRRCCWR